MKKGSFRLQTEHHASLQRMTQTMQNRQIPSLAGLRFLIVEDVPTVRTTLQLCLASLGANSIAFAQNHWEAINKIKASMPDVILCDYILGEGRTGQQLLEELRMSGLLSDAILFMMVTGETMYSQVVTAVELVPDDYILKPFTQGLLTTRLQSLVRKKVFFRPFYEPLIQKHYSQCLHALEKLQATPEGQGYRYDILRYTAETLVRANKLQEAQIQYLDLIQEGNFPWAKAGLARCYLHRGKHKEALDACNAAIAQVRTFTDAYELKAAIHADLGEYAEAMDSLQAAQAIAPNNARRKLKMADYANKLGEHAMAGELLREVMNSSSVVRPSLEDLLGLARAEVHQQNFAAANAILSQIDVTDIMPLEFRTSVESLRVLANPEQECRGFNALRRDLIATPLAPNAALDALAACIHTSDLQATEMVAIQALTGQHRRSAFPLVSALFQRHGMKEHFTRIKKKVADQLLHQAQQEKRNAQLPRRAAAR